MRKIVISLAAFIAGSIFTILVVAAFYYFSPLAAPDKTAALTLPPGFKTNNVTSEKDKVCLRVVSNCFANTAPGESVSNTQRCKALRFWFEEYPAATFEIRYSSVIGGCVLAQSAEARNNWIIVDVQGALSDKTLLFHCDRAGVDNIILSEVLKLEGRLYEAPYDRYLDNAEGGLPRTLREPQSPYTREKCKSVFERRLKELTSP